MQVALCMCVCLSLSVLMSRWGSAHSIILVKKITLHIQTISTFQSENYSRHFSSEALHSSNRGGVLTVYHTLPWNIRHRLCVCASVYAALGHTGRINKRLLQPFREPIDVPARGRMLTLLNNKNSKQEQIASHILQKSGRDESWNRIITNAPFS